MSDDLGAAAVATYIAMIGETGVGEDGAIMAAQLQRATGILDRPQIPFGSLWDREPSSHALALLRLAPEAAK